MTQQQIHLQNYTLLKDIITKHKRGYMMSLNYKYPKLKTWIYECTSFCDIHCIKFTTRIWLVLNKMSEFPKCKYCGKSIVKNIYRLTDPRMTYCSLKCAMSSEQTKEKRINTTLARFGCKHSSQSLQVKDKTHATLIKNGHIGRKTYYVKKQYNRSLMKKRNFFNNVLMQNKYVFPLFTIDDYMSMNKNIAKVQLLWKCKECENAFTGEFKRYKIKNDNNYVTYARCLKCHPYFGWTSCEERHIAEFLKTICPNEYEILQNNEFNMKVIYPYQLDIIVRNKTSKKICFAVEYDGSRWHSLEEGSELNRQLNKTLLCESKGISLIHIFEDDWLLNNDSEKLFLKKVMNSNNLFDYSLTKLVVDRSKYPKTIKPIGYKLVCETEPIIIKRKSLAMNIKYSVPNCGTLTYIKELTNGKENVILENR